MPDDCQIAICNISQVGAFGLATVTRLIETVHMVPYCVNDMGTTHAVASVHVGDTLVAVAVLEDASEQAGVPLSEITHLCVHPEHRRRGYATALLREIDSRHIPCIVRIPDAEHARKLRQWFAGRGYAQLETSRLAATPTALLVSKHVPGEWGMML